MVYSSQKLCDIQNCRRWAQSGMRVEWNGFSQDLEVKIIVAPSGYAEDKCDEDVREMA